LDTMIYSYHRIPDLKRHPKKNDMVFGSIWTGDTNGEYLNIAKKDRGKVPLVLMHMRWDGFVGFPGGKVDEGEELLDGLVRELKEEYNFDVNHRAVHLCSHADNHGELHTHNFEIRVNELEMREAIIAATEARNFLSEVQGIFAVQVAEFEANIGYSQFRKNNFKASAGMQLDALVKRHGWLPLN
jgi:U8 snoRNA-decapping enzyme